MTRIYLPLPLLLLLVIAGCGVTDPEPPTKEPGGVIMPLKVGNSWIGRNVEVESNGTVTLLTYDTLRIVRAVEIDGKTWYEANTGEVLRNDEKGLHVKLTSCTECSYHRAKYPGALLDTFGTEYATVLLPNPPQPVEARIFTQVVSRDTTIITLLRSFSCYHYRRRVESTDPSNPIDAVMIQEHEFYAPNIGPVKRIGRDGKRYWELVKYEV